MNTNSDIETIEEAQPLPDDVIAPEMESRSTSWFVRFMRKCGSAFSWFVYGIDRIFGELVAVVLGLGFAGLWMASSVLDRQSTDLTVLRPNIKMWFAEAFDGRDAEFGRLELAWRPATNNLVVTIEDAEIRDSNAEVLESFELVRLTLEPSPHLRTAPRLINAEVKGGVLTYLEDAQGQVTAGLGLPETVGRIEPVYRSEDVKEGGADFKSMLQGFEFVQIEDALICIRSERLGLDINSKIENLRVNFSEIGALTLTASGGVEQDSGFMPFTVNSISDSNFEDIRLKLQVTGARLDEIAPAKGRFWEFQGLAAPLDLTADIDFSRQDGLRAAAIDVDVGRGKLAFLREEGSQEFPIESLVAKASLAPGDERMDVEVFDLKAEKLSFNSSGFFTQLGNLNDGDVNSSPVFNLSMRNIWANMTPAFAVESRVKGLSLVGQIDVDRRRLDIFSGKLEAFDTFHNFNGAMTLQDDNTMKSIVLNSAMSGVLKPKQMLELWPVKSFQGARDWLDVALLDSDITKVDVEMSFDEAFFESKQLTPERLKFYFAGENTSVRFMQTLPIATNISGRGEIIGNNLKVFVEDGEVNEINLTGGNVEIPKLRPKFGDVVVSIDGQGKLSEFMRLADSPPFEIAKRYSVDPNSLSGEGEVTINVRRPMIPFLPADQVNYQINGDFRGASVPFDLGAHEIRNGDLSLDANTERVIIKGPIDIGPWRAETRWLETLGENAPPTQYGVSGNVDADVLDQLGLGSRTWFEGSAAVTIDAEGHGTDVKSAALDVDLMNAGLSLEGLWMKPIGETAGLSGNLARGVDNSYLIENAHISGSEIDIQGHVSLEPDFKLRQMALSQMSVESLIDGMVTITPDRVAGRLDVELDAAYLNVSPWTEDLFEERQSNLDVPLTLQGNVTELVLNEKYVVRDSEIYFSHTGEVIETARLEALSDDKPLMIELSTRDSLKRQFLAKVPDASKAVSAFMGLNNTTGGRLEISANLPAAGEEGAYDGVADMRDFKMKEAPAMAQLLSLASLTGLADTLNDGSMQFDRFKLPFTLLGDTVAIRDARLYGPALGMTGDGDIDLDLRVLDFDGTIVPAYTTNSFLADIPLLGDIFVHEKGGGLFALTYTVSGPFERTQIAVNPLSALTPGFLRRIFKRDRSKVDDALREAIADVQPKQAETP